ncbi:hypothetical protein BDU57DRAFT_541350 [Ampelomyces quisqualis]|uniref:Heme haloperoxidase family profile domain-containing protein n=1 Tax=Ampelomyces quisqualis TaxID=50730 RepID=A0A6A5QEV8_AMPQU|nr:hypothetical protein BDU57DRAFT_541350 [Ampelomyces quisqualis]
MRVQADKTSTLVATAQCFDPDIFAETLSYFGGATHVGVKEVAVAHWVRIQASRSRNRNFTYGKDQTFASYFERFNYHSLFKNPESNLAPVDWIKIFLQEEHGQFIDRSERAAVGSVHA